MKNEIDIIRSARIFKGIPADEFELMLATLDCQLKHYHSRQTILSPGRHISRAGFLLEGCVDINHESYWNDHTLLRTVNRGELFMESFACVRGAVSDFSVVAKKESIVLWFNLYDIMNLEDGGQYHSILIRNVISELASHELSLNHRMIHLGQHSTKEKILSYLSEQAFQNHSSEFDIPLDRQQLADYLSVERTAMSAELSKLHKAGYLDCNKNHFVLHQRKEKQII